MLSLTDSKPHQQMALRVQQIAVYVHITKRKPKSLQKKNSCIKGSVILGIYVIDIQRRYSIISKSFWMWIIFELLEGLVGFRKFRLAEMKSRPSAELDFSASETHQQIPYTGNPSTLP